MSKVTLRWGQDAGYQSKISNFAPRNDLATHGLKGEMQKGDLSFSRRLTRKQAEKDAMDGIPSSEAITVDQWSEREQLIVEEAENIRRGLGTWFSETRGLVRNFITDCTPVDVAPDALREAIKAEEDDLRHYEADDVIEAAARHEASIVELNEFRKKHHSRIGGRTPDIKKSMEQAIAVLLFIMIVEGGFNALLFKDAQSSGLLGGVLVAFGVSAVNVLFGVCAGFFGFRYLNHPKKPFRIIGGIVAGIFVTLGIFLNFFVAHFRDTVENVLHEAGASGSLASFSMFDITPASVIAAMFPNIFGLETLIAIGLLVIGLTIFCIALYEGYDRLSDRYPGYGRVWRKERRAYEDRQRIRNDVRDDLASFFTASRNWFDTQQSRHIAAKREIEKAINLLETRRDHALAIASRSADQERGLKIAYRQANRRTRNNLREELGDQAAIPAYFDEMVTPTLPSFDYDKERQMAGDAIKAIDQNVTALSISREWLETHIQKVQKGLSSIERKVQAEVADIRSKKRRDDRQVQTDEALRA